MNYSYGTLHITGSPAATDRHQGDLIRHALTVLYRSPEYAARCANDFRVVRRLPGYLTIHFSVPEGRVPTALVCVNDVLIDDRDALDEASYTAYLATRLGICHIAPSRDNVVRFALLPDATTFCVSEPQFRVVLPVIEYLNADPTIGKYEKGAIPEIRLSHLIAGPHEYRDLISACEGIEQSPCDIDFVLVEADDSRWGYADIHLVARKTRWKSNPQAVEIVSDQRAWRNPALFATYPNATVLPIGEALRHAVPAREYQVAPQTAFVKDRIATFLTWADQSSDYTQEHLYLLVQTGPGRGAKYHPPVTQDRFLNAAVMLSNYLAAPISREPVDGYPRPIDSAAIDAEVRAEIVAPAESSADTLDDYSLDDLEDIE